MMSATLLLVAATAANGPKVVLLDFTAEYCQACQIMGPVVRRMKHDGLPVRRIDISALPKLARRYRIEAIPTFLLLVDGQERGREIGVTPEVTLRRMISTAKLSSARAAVTADTGPTSRRGRASEGRRETAEREQREPKKRRFQLPFFGGRKREESSEPQPPVPLVVRANLGDGQPVLTDFPANDPIGASVRIKVRDGNRIDFGSGTIIDSKPGRSLILTCAHAIHRLSDAARIEVDLFNDGEHETYIGEIVDHHIDSDVGLIRIRTDQPLPVARISGTERKPAEGDACSSIGCAHGENPSVLSMHITSVDRYLGPANIECTHAPQDGRSGGALVNERGRVIGVCSAAFRDDNRGLYAGPDAIHQMLHRNRLSHLFESPDTDTNGMQAASAPQRVPVSEKIRPDAAVADRRSQANSDAPVFETQPSETTASVGSEKPSSAAHNRAGIQAVFESMGDAEVTCVIRPLNPREKSRVVIIPRASSRFIRWLEGEIDRQPTPTSHRVRRQRDVRRPADTQRATGSRQPRRYRRSPESRLH